MASKHHIQSLTEDVKCPICLEFFTDPATLACGHNFCSSCITQSSCREKRNSCPVCRRGITDRTLQVNRALARIAETTRALSLNTEGKESKLHCQKHQEELKLFCETDKQLICLICRDAREHKSHGFMPIQEAVENYKEQIETSLETLTKNKSAMEEMEQQQTQTISGVREQSQNMLTYITSVFDELRQIVNEKERLFQKELREEEESVLNPMENNLRAIREELNTIQNKFLKLQKRKKETDSLIFLKEETRQKSRISDEDQMLSVAEGALDFGKFDHLFLLNTVLRETIDSVKRVSVTLDVETAHPRLEVSEDRKRVRVTGTERNLPDTGKRFKDWRCVLGSEGFTSGRHYWVVDVTGNQYWNLGVAAESVQREGEEELSTETGVWNFRRWWDREYDAVTSPPPPLPGRVGVYLSYESGTVSFYDADTKSHLHSFTGNTFTEKLYPFFGTWDEDEWLSICSGSFPLHLEPMSSGP